MKKCNNKDLLILLGIALFFRLIVLAFLKSWLNPYALEYGQIAENILSGKGAAFNLYWLREDSPLKSFMPPLFPYLLAFLMLTVSKPYFYLLLIQVVLSSLTSVIVYYIGSWLYERKVGLIAGLCIALHPALIISSTWNFFYPSTIDIFLISLMLLLTVKAGSSNRIYYFFATGIVMGVVALSLPQIIAFYPFIILWFFINNVQGLIWKSIIVATMVVLTISPWMIRNYSVHGQLTSIATNGGFNFWLGNNPFTTGIGWEIDENAYRRYAGNRHLDDSIFEPSMPDINIYPEAFKSALKKKTDALLPRNIADKIGKLPEVTLDSSLFQAGLNYIAEYPTAYMKRCLKKMLYLWVYRPTEGRRTFFAGMLGIFYVIQYAFLTPFVAGGVAVSTQQNWRTPLILYMIMIFFTLLYMNFFVLSRYRWLFEPYMIIVASSCIVFLWRKYCGRDARKLFKK